MLPVAAGRAPAQLRRRLYAVLIDALLVGVPFVFFLALLGAEPEAILHAALDLGLAATGWREWSDAPSALNALLQTLLLALSVFLYLFLCKRRWGESIGRRQAGVRVVVSSSGAEPSFARLYVREAVKVVSIVALLVWIPVTAFPIILEAFAEALCNYEPGEFHEGFCAVGAAYYASVALSLMPIGGAFLLWIIPFMRRDKRAVHDLLTNTLAARAESAAGPPPPAHAED